MSTIPQLNLVRASIQGIIYLVDSARGHAYTYNPQRPVYVGDLERIPEEDKHSISKTNGCLAAVRIRYRPDIYDVMARERGLIAEEAASPLKNETPLVAPTALPTLA